MNFIGYNVEVRLVSSSLSNSKEHNVNCNREQSAIEFFFEKNGRGVARFLTITFSVTSLDLSSPGFELVTPVNGMKETKLLL